ncbi:UNVERIFIED_CONTAM: putative tRNA/rRNA methyltransferase YsgA [Sesamum angustifolium]|uniref:tRNA/rRNA methyltransferase YsgA n=1 Tax=Sesamum angustifolium TaxID=2727405 RepID=A0AAW2LYG6_9LAMI
MENENTKKEKYESYVVVHNIAKGHNVGTLARSATAFGVSELIMVGGATSTPLEATAPPHTSGSGTSTLWLLPARSSRLQLTEHVCERDCDICGVEITDNAMAINEHPFRKSTAFLLGNEGTGLSAKECEICDFFVYIPQYGGGTASLNVTVAASIILHHFGVWAGFSERTREGNKFLVAEKPANQVRRSFCTESAESIAEERRLKKENAANGFFDENGKGEAPSNLLDALFDP